MSQSVKEIAKREGFFWGDESGYFDAAERDFAVHWDNVIYPFISDLSYDSVLDLASGHGRNAQALVQKARSVICADVNPENITFLKKRFGGDARFKVIQNSGADLAFCADSSIDLFYCFDAMVHFDLEIVQAYVKEAYRVLRHGGYAFIHVSNYTGSPGGDFRDSPHWRNFMSVELFTHLALRAGFKIVKLRKLDWGGVPEIDGVFLLAKMP